MRRLPSAAPFLATLEVLTDLDVAAEAVGQELAPAVLARLARVHGGHGRDLARVDQSRVDGLELFGD